MVIKWIDYTIALSMMLIQSSSAVAQDAPQAAPLEHFKCYKTLGQPPNDVAILRDQFDAMDGGIEFAQVLNAIRLCNPVTKDHDGTITEVENPDHHLKLHFMLAFPQGGPRDVIVGNQFGDEQRLTVNRALIVAVPTQKSPHDSPVGLDHFKCYIAQGEPVDADVVLKDQFMPEDGARVLNPILFCNPTIKVHNGQVTPIQHPEEHLVCYLIEAGNFSGDVATRNQFIEETMEVGSPDLLCAPSKKLSVIVVFDGLDHVALEDARLTLKPDATGGQDLVISNIGSSGLDGVSIDVGKAALWQADMVSEQGKGSTTTLTAVGGHPGAPSLPISTLVRAVGESETGGVLASVAKISASFESATYRMEILLDGNIVRVIDDIPSGSVAARIPVPEPIDICDIIPWWCEGRDTFRVSPGGVCEFDIEFDLNVPGGAVEIQLAGGQMILAAQIRLIENPDHDPEEMLFTKMEITAANVPSFTLLSETVIMQGP